MPDITIAHPGRIADFEQRLATARLKAENDTLLKEVERLNGIVSAIFDGIARGDTPELKYDDGNSVLIAKYRPRNREGGE